MTKHSNVKITSDAHLDASLKKYIIAGVKDIRALFGDFKNCAEGKRPDFASKRIQFKGSTRAICVTPIADKPDHYRVVISDIRKDAFGTPLILPRVIEACVTGFEPVSLPEHEDPCHV